MLLYVYRKIFNEEKFTTTLLLSLNVFILMNLYFQGLHRQALYDQPMFENGYVATLDGNIIGSISYFGGLWPLNQGLIDSWNSANVTIRDSLLVHFPYDFNDNVYFLTSSQTSENFQHDHQGLLATIIIIWILQIISVLLLTFSKSNYLPLEEDMNGYLFFFYYWLLQPIPLFLVGISGYMLSSIPDDSECLCPGPPQVFLDNDKDFSILCLIFALISCCLTHMQGLKIKHHLTN